MTTTKIIPKRQEAITESEVLSANICRRANMSDLDYRLMFLELGCQFIDRLFDVPGYRDMVEFYLFNTDSLYWKWWRSQWMEREREIYRLMSAMPFEIRFDEEKAFNLFALMLSSDLVSKSFDAHAKHLNER